MPKLIINKEQKEENFDAIAPQKNHPVLITTNAQPQSKGRGGFGKAFFVLFLFAAGGAVWFYFQYANLQAQLTDFQAIQAQNQEAQDEGISLLDRINQHILLPHNEEPKIITLKNIQELKNKETFYEYAQDGDALVQFHSLEIIYNSAADVIVNARTRGTVAGAETRAVQGAITIDIRNGAGVAGLAGKTAETFKGVKDFIVQSVGNASRSDYSKTIVVNLSNKEASGLEKQFNATSVRDLPAGEQPSSADVVIILGKS
ncbi:MAG: LytR C-terminal domain-containing protein [Patescibacteria group bacterium]